MDSCRLFCMMASVILFAALFMGCFGDDEESTPDTEIEIIGGDVKAAPGTSTVVPFIVKNNRDEDDALKIEAASVPSGWSANFSATAFNLTDGGMTTGSTKGVFLTVQIPNGTTDTTQKVKVKVTSTKFTDYSTEFEVKIIVEVHPATDLARKDQSVAINYIGWLDGTFEVFDTSIEGIGSDSSFKKASSFTSHTYSNLEFKIGDGTMIKGFDTGATGMFAGQTLLVKVPPDMGYGVFNEVKVNTTETVDMIQTINITEFRSRYSIEPTVSTTVTHAFWKWNCTIIGVTEDVVRIRNEPTVHDVVTPYGWNTTVTAVESAAQNGTGAITIRHATTTGFEFTYNAFPAYVSAVNTEQITFQYNSGTHSLSTKTLWFVIVLKTVSY